MDQICIHNGKITWAKLNIATYKFYFLCMLYFYYAPTHKCHVQFKVWIQSTTIKNSRKPGEVEPVRTGLYQFELDLGVVFINVDQAAQNVSLALSLAKNTDRIGVITEGSSDDW